MCSIREGLKRGRDRWRIEGRVFSSRKIENLAGVAGCDDRIFLHGKGRDDGLNSRNERVA